jgi:hypothetical protein
MQDRTARDFSQVWRASRNLPSSGQVSAVPIPYVLARCSSETCGAGCWILLLTRMATWVTQMVKKLKIIGFERLKVYSCCDGTWVPDLSFSPPVQVFYGHRSDVCQPVPFVGNYRFQMMSLHFRIASSFWASGLLLGRKVLVCLTKAKRRLELLVNYCDEGTGRFAYRVEQDVGGLEVAVDHRRVGVVEEGEALGRAHGDLHPRHPREGAVDACSEKDVSCEFVSSSALMTNIKQARAIPRIFCSRHETWHLIL